MTPVSTIDWEKARARLRASEKALEEALNTSAERVQAVFRQRASRLAQPRGADKGTSKTVALLVFRLASERYGVALTELAEVLPYKGCTRVPGSAPQFPGVISLRGELRPVLDLGLALTGNRGSETGFVLIPRRGHVGLKVDEVDGMREIRSEELSPPGQSRYIRGLAPGALMVLDTDALLSTVSSPKEESRPL